MRHLLSIDDLTTETIVALLQQAARFREGTTCGTRFLLEGKTLALLFQEPSTRTILSFQKAMRNLGGDVMRLDMRASSACKGESLDDTLMTVACYADAIVLRQPAVLIPGNGPVSLNVPLINAGDGAGEHPTQALTDLFTLMDRKQRVEGLTVVFLGDTKRSRTVHSLVRLLGRFPNNRCLLRHDFQDHEWDEDTILRTADAVYLTRQQQERGETEPTSPLRFDRSMLKKLGKETLVMHPLPRNHEMDPEIDDDPRCVHFDQVKNGVHVRMAVLAHIMATNFEQ